MRRGARFVTLCGVIALAGCGSPSGQPDSVVRSAVPVSGQVQLADGKPAANLWVVFHPKDPPGNEASGPTNPDGTFRVGTFTKEDGAVPGRYVVTVEPHPHAKGAVPPIPKKYSSRETSPFSVEVKTGGASQLEPFVLK